MSDLSEKLAAIEARRDPEGCTAHDNCLKADVAFLLGLVRGQAPKLAKVEALVQEALDKPAYILPGGYPSKPVEAFDLRKVMDSR